MGMAGDAVCSKSACENLYSTAAGGVRSELAAAGRGCVAACTSQHSKLPPHSYHTIPTLFGCEGELVARGVAQGAQRG